MVLGQCTQALRSTLKGESEYEDKSGSLDVLWLLKKLKKITAGVDAKANPVLVLHEQITSFFSLRQGNTEREDDYLVRFNGKLKSLEMMGGEHIFVSPIILGSTIDAATREAIAIQKEEFLAMCFFIRADERRYGDLQEDLKKGVFRGRDEYPKTVSDAYQLLLRTSRQLGYQGSGRRNTGNRFRGNGSNTNPVILVQNANTSENASEPVPGNDGILHADILCYACRTMGHYAGNCPTVPRGVNALQTGVSFAQKSNQLESSWVLLDTCSTHSVSNNKKLVRDIVDCTRENFLTMSTNGGDKTFTKKAILRLLPIPVHFEEDSLATVISLKDIANIDGVYVTMDSRV